MIDASNALGYVGAAIALSSYLARTRLGLLLVTAAGLSLLAVHYALLGAATTALLCVFGVVRCGVAPCISGLPAHARWWATAIAVVCAVVLATMSWHDWRSGISLVAAIVLVLGNFHLRGPAIRQSLYVVEALFAFNALALGSLPGSIVACCGVALNAWSQRRRAVRPPMRVRGLGCLFVDSTAGAWKA